jgi:fructose-1,6-bisphosphatase/inositol monophosphatase family enzyme
LFVSEAGGKVTDCDGKPLPLDRASSLCATNTRLHDPALAIIAAHWSKLKAEQGEGS